MILRGASRSFYTNFQPISSYRTDGLRWPLTRPSPSLHHVTSSCLDQSPSFRDWGEGEGIGAKQQHTNTGGRENFISFHGKWGREKGRKRSFWRDRAKSVHRQKRWWCGWSSNMNTNTSLWAFSLMIVKDSDCRKLPSKNPHPSIPAHPVSLILFLNFSSRPAPYRRCLRMNQFFVNLSSYLLLLWISTTTRRLYFHNTCSN